VDLWEGGGVASLAARADCHNRIHNQTAGTSTVPRVSAEARGEQRAGQTLTAEQGMALVAALAASVRRHVTDRQALAAISREMEAILAGIGAIAG
jgi:hypothetical protein